MGHQENGEHLEVMLIASDHDSRVNTNAIHQICMHVFYNRRKDINLYKWVQILLFNEPSHFDADKEILRSAVLS